MVLVLAAAAARFEAGTGVREPTSSCCSVPEKSLRGSSTSFPRNGIKSEETLAGRDGGHYLGSDKDEQDCFVHYSSPLPFRDNGGGAAADAEVGAPYSESNVSNYYVVVSECRDEEEEEGEGEGDREPERQRRVNTRRSYRGINTD